MKTDEMRSRLSLLFDIVSSLITALTVIVLLLTSFFRIVGVDGDSMQPTLYDGNRVVLWCAGDDYRAGDIVVADRYTKKPLIKRVIAVGGDTVYIDRDFAVYVNDVKQEEPFIQGVTEPRDLREKYTVPDGYLFVMGDNRTVSNDSRAAEIGPISEKDVIGKFLFRIWPIS